MNKQEIKAPESLYIHIPFCKKRCNYCTFFSTTGSDNSIINKILSETLNQIEYLFHLYDNPDIKTIYIGGGTPNILKRETLFKFLSSLNNILTYDPAEWTIELNPFYIDKDLLSMLQDIGITRLSVGIQSFNDNFLNILGRQGSRDRNIESLNCIKEFWKGILNLDLICCIPYQTCNDALKDINTAINYDPDHISLYTLSIEDGTPMYDLIKKGKIENISESLSEEIWLNCIDILNSTGYTWYEISNFAKPGKECLHNLNYWQMKQYAGCGPGAVSTLSYKEKVLRIENTKNFDLFLKGKPAYWNIKTETINPRDFFFEHLIMGFRLKTGINYTRISGIFGKDINCLIPETISKWEKMNLLKTENDYIRLNKKGRLILNSFLIDAATELENTGIDFCSWPVQ